MNSFFNRDAINLDITNKCTLDCPKCGRYVLTKLKNIPTNAFPGHMMTEDEFDKCLSQYDRFVICGQISDPILHPQLPKFLEKIYRANKRCSVHVAASQKPKDFFLECFESNPTAAWYFGIDGLPEDSHKYRIRQDGEKLFDMMLESKNYINKTVWQYIVFKYNQDDIEEAKAIANLYNIELSLVYSSRWTGEDDPYKPSKDFRVERSNKQKNYLKYMTAENRT